MAAIIRAACGKDRGYNPLSLLESMRRSARIDPGQLPTLRAAHLDPQALKRRWQSAAESASRSVIEMANQQPELEIGVVFVDGGGTVQWPDPARTPAQQGLTIHRPSVGGCVPIIRAIPPA
jgi:hypothetical protein